MHPSYLQYFAKRARGGAAMVITDPFGIAPHQGKDRLIAWNDSMEGDLRRLADSVRENDCALLAQIQDSGRGRHVPGRTHNTIGASPLPDDLSYSMPHPLRVEEIDAFVASSAASALRMQRCGFSGVEISAGHGHLFHQFLSPRSNQREDAYGGQLAGRARLLVEVCQAIRRSCGTNFILGVKLPGDDGVPGGIGPIQAGQIASHLCGQVKVDYLSYAQGSHHRSLEMHLPDESYPRMAYMGLLKTLRQATPGIPVMGLGRITDPAEAEGIVARGEAELVGLGRALIADPAWPRKARAGLAREIRYCVSCNTCWKTINSNRHIGCDNNPRLSQAQELDVPDAAAQRCLRVVVVGAGIAGLEAAITAAARGHTVIVLGRSDEVGGKTRLLARLPLGESHSSIYDYQQLAVGRSGIELRLGHEATVQDILDLQPDAVVLATGSTMTWPVGLPATLQQQGVLDDLRAALPALLSLRQRQKGTAVIYDMDQTDGTYAAAEFLCDRFERVVLLSPRETIAEECVLVMRQRILRRFHERGIEVKTMVEPVWTESMEDESRLHYRSVFGGPLQAIEDVAFFSYASPRQPNTALLQPLIDAGLLVHTVGDCKSARDALSATAEGYAVGCAI
jgi:2,4-dienoyl-CoA reductase-like NADH-dependent reductase (Old Yellow Enzyme family)